MLLVRAEGLIDIRFVGFQPTHVVFRGYRFLLIGTARLQVPVQLLVNIRRQQFVRRLGESHVQRKNRECVIDGALLNHNVTRESVLSQVMVIRSEQLLEQGFGLVLPLGSVREINLDGRLKQPQRRTDNLQRSQRREMLARVAADVEKLIRLPAFANRTDRGIAHDANDNRRLPRAAADHDALTARPAAPQTFNRLRILIVSHITVLNAFQHLCNGGAQLAPRGYLRLELRAPAGLW